MILDLQQDLGRKILLVVDGIDRVRERATLRSLFVDSTLLASLDCHLVVPAPLTVLRELAWSVRGFETKELANVPVLQRSNPAAPGPGIPFFCDLFRRRLADLGEGDRTPAPIPQPVLERLAYYSGGAGQGLRPPRPVTG